ncbi:MAG: hypothetical protein KAI53_00850 [Candidatus Aenigmarchaeota archaeon]|nr:hypothetical protein [Candidatus Aenigmarchaeota archaeon]
MNKTILFALVVLVASANFVFAEPSEIMEPNAHGRAMDAVDPDAMMDMIQTMVGNQAQLQTREQFDEAIRQKDQEMKAKTETMSGGKKQAYQNQNEVRLAVHTIHSMGNMIGSMGGGIGTEISAIAKQYNNSIQASLQAEEKIQSRSSLKRFFFGGDNDAAADLESEMLQNQNQLRELTQLKEQCDCTDEAKLIMQEQIQTMEQEQERIKELANAEKQSKGILGWLYK